jgi:excisionase family DNA binding protein
MQLPQPPAPRPQQRAFKLKDAATILGIAPSTIRRLIQRGMLKPCMAVRHVLIPGSEIDRLLNN